MLTIVNLFSIYVSVQRLLNCYPNYFTHRLYFGEVETPYSNPTLWVSKFLAGPATAAAVAGYKAGSFLILRAPKSISMLGNGYLFQFQS